MELDFDRNRPEIRVELEAVPDYDGYADKIVTQLTSASAPDLFGKAKKKALNHEAEVDELHRQIGKLKVENDFLSNLPGLNLTGRRNRR